MMYELRTSPISFPKHIPKTTPSLLESNGGVAMNKPKPSQGQDDKVGGEILRCIRRAGACSRRICCTINAVHFYLHGGMSSSGTDRRGRRSLRVRRINAPSRRGELCSSVFDAEMTSCGNNTASNMSVRAENPLRPFGAPPPKGEVGCSCRLRLKYYTSEMYRFWLF